MAESMTSSRAKVKQTRTSAPRAGPATSLKRPPTMSAVRAARRVSLPPRRSDSTRRRAQPRALPMQERNRAPARPSRDTPSRSPAVPSGPRTTAAAKGTAAEKSPAIRARVAALRAHRSMQATQPASALSLSRAPPRFWRRSSAAMGRAQLCTPEKRRARKRAVRMTPAKAPRIRMGLVAEKPSAPEKLLAETV